MQPWGFIEVVGYVPAVAAADAMTKAAKVELVGTEVIGGGYVTVAVKGDIAAVRTAVDAGTEAGSGPPQPASRQISREKVKIEIIVFRIPKHLH